MPNELPAGFIPDKQPQQQAQSQGAAGLPAGFTLDKAAEPETGGVDLMTQTLYDMAKTPVERKRALEHGYGVGNVREDAEGLYALGDGGKRLKPGKSGKAVKAGAFLLSEAAPTIGAIGGSMAGGAVGNIPGALGGAAAGSAAGQGFNDMMLGLAGVYDRSLGQEGKELGVAGAFGAAGEGAGRLVGRGLAAATKEGGVLSKAGRWWLGVDEESIARAKELAEAGINVPPEAYAKEAGILPYIRTWARKFGYDPVAKTAAPYYEKSAGKVLQDLGVPADKVGNLTKPRADVSYEETGEALIKKAQQTLLEDDAKMDASLASLRSSMDRKMTSASEAHKTQIDDLTKAASAARKSAEAVIDHGWNEIDKTSERMFQAAKLGEEPGNLARQYASRIWNMRQAVMRRARKMYSAADAVSGGQMVDVGKMTDTATQMLSQLPEELQKQFPGLVRSIESMQAGQLPFGEAHYLRSVLRSIPNWTRLEPKLRDGLFKKLSGELNAALHAPENSAKVKDAVKLLDEADGFYSKEMGRFKDSQVKSLTDSVKAGLPPDPEVIAEKVLKGGYAERAGELKRLVGPQVWDATIAADVKGMMQDSQSIVPGLVDAQAFGGQVIDRIRSGALNHYPPELQKMLREQAMRVGALNGKVDVPHLPSDDFRTFLTRANDMVTRIEELSKINPIETLQSDLKMAEQQFKASREAVQSQRAADQLSFLTKPNALASESAKRIVRDPDLLRSALLRFDADGPEIKLLRQTAARDMLTMGIESGGKLMDRLTKEGMTPEVQKRLFPNGLDQDVIKLAENMEMLFPKGSDVFGALSAGSVITNPGRLVPHAGKALTGLPTPILRMTVGKSLSAAANMITSPRFVKFLAKGTGESEAERETVRQAILSIVQTGGDVGAVSGSMMGQQATQPDDPRRYDAGARGATWRDRYADKYAKQQPGARR